MFINLQNFGIDQSFTQRYVAAKSLTAAKRSLMSSAFLYLVNTVFFVLIGTMLWMYVQSNPGVVPESVLAKSDAVFPWFIVHRLPVGISGLLVAAIAAAAMSTVSSTLNSGATVLLEDYRKRFSSRKDNEHANIAFLRSATVGLGVLSIAIGIGVMNVKSALTAFWAFQSVLSGCRYRYVPTFKSVFLAAHIQRTRHMKCPKCGQWSWHKKVLTKDLDKKK